MLQLRNQFTGFGEFDVLRWPLMLHLSSLHMVVAKQHPSTQLDLSATRMQELIPGARPNALSQ